MSLKGCFFLLLFFKINYLLKNKKLRVSAELIYTERAHVRMLRVLDLVFYQKLSKEAILPPADIKNIFTNLEEILQLHGTEHRVKLRGNVQMSPYSSFFNFFFFFY